MKLIRYADDFLSWRATERRQRRPSALRWPIAKLGLQLKEEKTHIASFEKVPFSRRPILKQRCMDSVGKAYS